MVSAQRMTGRGPVCERRGRGTARTALWLAGVVAVVLWAMPSVAKATEPAATYDAAGQKHDDVCVKFARGLSSLNLRYLSGGPTGFALLPGMLEFTDGSCAKGQLRLDLHEVVTVPSSVRTYDPSLRPSERLVFHRGGSGYLDAQNVRYGQLAASQLSKLPKPVPSGGGRGNPCQTVLDTPYEVSVQPIPEDMKYKSPAQAGGDNAGASYLHYGDPAAQQGNPSNAQIHYSTLTWSWIDVAGGGHNRILLAPGQDIRLCDVDPIKRDSWAPSSEYPDGLVNGWVIARYVQTRVGDGPTLYGWMVWQHHFEADGNNPDGSPVVVNHFSSPA